VEWKIPIVKLEWILDSFQKQQQARSDQENDSTRSATNLFELNPDTVLDCRTYILPPFAGLSITISGLQENGERSEIRNLINKHGGTYLGELDMERTTHLVAKVCFCFIFMSLQRYFRSNNED
jgi:hypothetical protein